MKWPSDLISFYFCRFESFFSVSAFVPVCQVIVLCVSVKTIWGTGNCREMLLIRSGCRSEREAADVERLLGPGVPRRESARQRHYDVYGDWRQNAWRRATHTSRDHQWRHDGWWCHSGFGVTNRWQWRHQGRVCGVGTVQSAVSRRQRHRNDTATHPW